MKKNEGGFSTPLAMTVIFSLSVITLSLCMLVSANSKRFNSYKNYIEARKEVNTIIYTIEKRFQNIKSISCDNENVIKELQLNDFKRAENFLVEDVSTGINRQFAAETFLNNKYIKKYVEENTDTVFVDYSWINPKFTEKQFLSEIEQSFDTNNIFPLKNSFPPLNLANMNISFIKTILDYYEIKDSENKAVQIKNFLTDDTETSQIANILSVSRNHPVFDLIGTKTVFWKVSFETKKYKVTAIYALVPESENQKKIDKYMLIRKEILLKGGNK